MTVAVLLFGDLDPVDVAITHTFRKNLKDMSRATGYTADKLIIKRFGLNKDFIDAHKFVWIVNLMTSGGRNAMTWRWLHDDKTHVSRELEDGASKQASESRTRRQ